MANVRALELQVDPRRSRWFFALLCAGALLLIWAGALTSMRQQRVTLETEFQERMRIDTLMLEEHASRTLDTVVARVSSMAALLTPEALAEGRVDGEQLADLIREDKILRSLSLVDDTGTVLVSSSPANLGAVVPPVMLPGGSDLTSEGIFWGQVWPQRDLVDFASGPPASQRRGAASWVAASPLKVGERTLQIVAVVNLGVFETLWARVDTDKAHELALFDLRGLRLVTHHGFLDNDNELRLQFEQKALGDPVGRFDLGTERLPVAYRVSARHPVVMAAIGNLDILEAENQEYFALFLVGGLLATLVVLVVLGLVYRSYLRYEASVIEMTNQARAIGAHLMLSESTPDGIITYVNEAYQKACGYSLGELIGQNHRIFKSGIHPQSYYENLWQTVLAGRIWKGTFRNRRKDGSIYWVNATVIPYLDAWGKVTRFVAFYTDMTESMALQREITEERRQRQQLAELNRQLVAEALTDPLTGLANRRAFDRFAQRVAEPSGRTPRGLALLMLDLDHFKRVNDTHGHAAGDEVLREAARRWQQAVRDSDLVARLGGEEFCVLLPGSDFEGAQAVARKLCQATASAPFAVSSSLAAAGGATQFPVTVSVGLAWTGDARGMDLQVLSQSADEALYEAKRGGRNRVSSRRCETAPSTASLVTATLHEDAEASRF